jgi:XTP/dITP diphosphohydrolase
MECVHTPLLYAATSNVGKLRDFSAAAKLFGADIEPLPGVREMDPPREDGVTFEANARIKAIFYSRHRPDALVVADDSGLEVDALDGAPGVRSARYAADSGAADSDAVGASADLASAGSVDAWNNRHLLAQLIDVPEAKRSARYRCVLVLVREGEVLATAEGTVEGAILNRPRGAGGFGYDSLFYLPELRLTMAEVDLETKQRLSHRGRALQALLQSEALRRLSFGRNWAQHA